MKSGERAKIWGTEETEHSKKQVSGPPSEAMHPTPKHLPTIRGANAVSVFTKSQSGFLPICPNSLHIDASLSTEDSQSPRSQGQWLWLRAPGHSAVSAQLPRQVCPLQQVSRADPMHSLCLVPFLGS